MVLGHVADLWNGGKDCRVFGDYFARGIVDKDCYLGLAVGCKAGFLDAFSIAVVRVLTERDTARILRFDLVIFPVERKLVSTGIYRYIAVLVIRITLSGRESVPIRGIGRERRIANRRRTASVNS